MRIEGNRVVGHKGDVLAEKVYGEWQSKDQAVLDFIASSKGSVKEELVRARDEDGKFIPDDPTTPDVNEAWVSKIKKKVKETSPLRKGKK